MNLVSLLKQSPMGSLSYEHLNPLINKEPDNYIKELVSPNMASLELKVMVISKVSSFLIKDRMVHRYLVADQTGSILLNLFGSLASSIKESHILYINNAYTMVYKGELILVEGKQGLVMLIGQLYFLFNDQLNMSTLYAQQQQNKQHSQ